MEESMEHCFFIEEQAIKVLFRNCPGSAKRSGERGKKRWSSPVFACPRNSNSRGKRLKDSAKPGPRPTLHLASTAKVSCWDPRILSK